MPRDDELIKKDVVEQLYWNGRVDASDVSVSVDGGTVELEGTVPTFLAWEAALDSARIVPGVRQVRDELAIEFEEARPIPTDSELQDKVESVLTWNPDIDDSDIDTKVEGGMVTLEGSVEAYWKKIHAEDVVARLDGVLTIENELTVVPTDDILDKSIAEDVQSALQRNILIDEERINVRVEDGVVTLTGTVDTWAGERAAYQAALYTTGVIDVRDNLTILAS